MTKEASDIASAAWIQQPKIRLCNKIFIIHRNYYISILAHLTKLRPKNESIAQLYTLLYLVGRKGSTMNKKWLTEIPPAPHKVDTDRCRVKPYTYCSGQGGGSL